MSTTKERNNRVIHFLLLLGITTVVVLCCTLKRQYEASLASANHPLEVALDRAFFSCVLIAIFFFVATVVGFVWYDITVPNKSRFGILRATMLTLPALISVLACWGWMIALWCTGDGASDTGSHLQEQLALASVVSGQTFAVLLPVVLVSGIMRKGLGKISWKLTPKQKGYVRFALLLLAILFAFGAMAVILFMLETCNDLSRQYPVGIFTWWLHPSPVLHCCAALIAGIELFFGILYVFNRDRRKVPIGSLLLSSSVMKYLVIFACLCDVMDTANKVSFISIRIFNFCAPGLVLQCVVPFILYAVTAILRKRRHSGRNDAHGTPYTKEPKST